MKSLIKQVLKTVLVAIVGVQVVYAASTPNNGATSVKDSVPVPPPVYIAVVVNPSNDLSPKLIMQRLHQVFTLRTTLSTADGSYMVPVDNKDVQVKQAFYHTVVGWTLDDLSSYWDDQVFSGGKHPLNQLSTQEVIQYVETHPEGIGYVPVRALYVPNPISKDKVKVLSVFKVSATSVN